MRLRAHPSDLPSPLEGVSNRKHPEALDEDMFISSSGASQFEWMFCLMSYVICVRLTPAHNPCKSPASHTPLMEDTANDA